MNDPLAQALDGLMLLCALALTMPRRPGPMIALARIQSAVLSGAACWQAHVMRAPALYVAAAATLLLNALMFPRLLRRAAPAAGAAPRLPPALSSALAITLSGVALLAIPPGISNLGIPLGVLLTSLLLLASVRDPRAQTIGVLTLANALLLGAITLPSPPFVPEFAVALAALTALSFLFGQNPGGYEAG